MFVNCRSGNLPVRRNYSELMRRIVCIVSPHHPNQPYAIKAIKQPARRRNAAAPSARPRTLGAIWMPQWSNRSPARRRRSRRSQLTVAGSVIDRTSQPPRASRFEPLSDGYRHSPGQLFQLGGSASPPPNSAVFGLDRVERDERGVGNALGERDPVACALKERDADHHAVAHDERGQIALLRRRQGGGDAHALLGEGLAAREARSRGRPSMKPAKPSGSSACTSVNRRSVQSPASVSIRRGSSRGSSPIRSATMSAVSRARNSGLHHRAMNGIPSPRPRSRARPDRLPGHAPCRRAGPAGDPGSGAPGCRRSGRGGPGRRSPESSLAGRVRSTVELFLAVMLAARGHGLCGLPACP